MVHPFNDAIKTLCFIIYIMFSVQCWFHIATVYNNSCSHCNARTAYYYFFFFWIAISRKGKSKGLKMITLLIHSIGGVFLGFLTFSFAATLYFLHHIGLFVLNGCNETTWTWVENVIVSVFSSFFFCFVFITNSLFCCKCVESTIDAIAAPTSATIVLIPLHLKFRKSGHLYFHKTVVHLRVYGHLGCCLPFVVCFLFLVRLFSIFLLFPFILVKVSQVVEPKTLHIQMHILKC